MKAVLALAAAVLPGAFPAAAHGAAAHVHGSAVLQVVVEGDRLALDFTSPLENLVGFEHAPRTEKQKQALQQMNERLQQPERLFVPTPEAGCRRDAVKVNTTREKGGHAELASEIVFRCERAEKLVGLEVKLFDAFPGLKRVDAQVAGPKKQAAAKLSSANRRLSW